MLDICFQFPFPAVGVRGHGGSSKLCVVQRWGQRGRVSELLTGGASGLMLNSALIEVWKWVSPLLPCAEIKVVELMTIYTCLLQGDVNVCW